MSPKPPCPDVQALSEADRMAAIKRRLDKRREYFNAKMDRVIRQEMKKASPGEYVRAWIDKHAQGLGLDICCGNYPVDNAIGVDSAYDVLGNNFNFRGDNLASFTKESFNFVACNYFDCFDNPLKVLNEWHRVLKPQGKVILVASNADCYDSSDLPLNGKRQFLYTPHTISLFMHKIGWANFSVQCHLSSILVLGSK